MWTCSLKRWTRRACKSDNSKLVNANRPLWLPIKTWRPCLWQEEVLAWTMANRWEWMEPVWVWIRLLELGAEDLGVDTFQGCLRRGLALTSQRTTRLELEFLSLKKRRSPWTKPSSICSKSITSSKSVLRWSSSPTLFWIWSAIWELPRKKLSSRKNWNGNWKLIRSEGRKSWTTLQIRVSLTCWSKCRTRRSAWPTWPKNWQNWRKTTERPKSWETTKLISWRSYERAWPNWTPLRNTMASPSRNQKKIWLNTSACKSNLSIWVNRRGSWRRLSMSRHASKKCCHLKKSATLNNSSWERVKFWPNTTSESSNCEKRASKFVIWSSGPKLRQMTTCRRSWTSGKRQTNSYWTSIRRGPPWVMISSKISHKGIKILWTKQRVVVNISQPHRQNRQKRNKISNSSCVTTKCKSFWVKSGRNKRRSYGRWLQIMRPKMVRSKLKWLQLKKIWQQCSCDSKPKICRDLAESNNLPNLLMPKRKKWQKIPTTHNMRTNKLVSKINKIFLQVVLLTESCNKSVSLGKSLKNRRVRIKSRSK